MKRNDHSSQIRHAVGKKKSSAASVVEQSRIRAKNGRRVTQLPTTRLEVGTDNAGKQTLTAFFANKVRGEPLRYDLSFLLEFSGLKDLFAEAFIRWGRDQTPSTRITSLRFLKRDWFAYLNDEKLQRVTPERLDEQVMAGFNQWLHGRTQENGDPLSLTTIASRLSSLRSILAAVPKGKPIAALVPNGPRGAHRAKTPTEGLSWPQLMQIWEAAEKETRALRYRWEHGRKLLQQGRELISEGRDQRDTIQKNGKGVDALTHQQAHALALALIDNAYPGCPPSIEKLTRDDNALAYTMRAIGRGNITPYLYASARDLVPLSLLIAIATAFNPDTLLKLEWKNIDRNVDRLGAAAVAISADENGDDGPLSEMLDEPLLSIAGVKQRANQTLRRLLDPTSSDPTQVGLNEVLDLLRDMTARPRPLAIQEHRDRLFIYVQEKGRESEIPKGFGNHKRTGCGDNTWAHALGSFCRDNGLAKFNLKQIRFTLLDYVKFLNRGSLEATRQLGDHKGLVTGWNHYTSSLFRKLLQESTGEILLTRERWIDTKGIIDPRVTPINADKSAATPGFDCLDPFDSPRPNQKTGLLCRAYGECPSCALVTAKPLDASTVMYWEALLRAIYRSVSTMSAAMWMERWAPIAADLMALIQLVPERILNESRRIRIEIPNVG